MVKGKRVLVTGASRGIGEQLAYHYARMGANLVITARNEHLLKQVLGRCHELGLPEAKMDYVTGDMANESEREKVVEFAVEVLGGLDQLILNHGYYTTGSRWTGSRQNLTDLRNKYMEVNFLAYVHVWSLALPYLSKSHHGALGVVSGAGGKIPIPFMTEYSAAKFAQDGFFSSMRLELEAENVNVTITLNILGIIGTEHTKKALLGDFLDNFKVHKDWFYSINGVNDPAITAYHIIQATTLGEREMYYPAEVKLLPILRHIVPWIENILSVHTYE